ncbi:MAG: hypothetical protein ACI3XT_04150, partial [Butyricicoccaceae bacterium]
MIFKSGALLVCENLLHSLQEKTPFVKAAARTGGPACPAEAGRRELADQMMAAVLQKRKVPGG